MKGGHNRKATSIKIAEGTVNKTRLRPPPKKSPDGREVGATLGLLRSLLMLLTSPGVTHVAVAFDHVIEDGPAEAVQGLGFGVLACPPRLRLPVRPRTAAWVASGHPLVHLR